MERKLAHIERIAWVKPIEGADNIEKIGVLGWVLIAKKEEFKEGDWCCFFEIDSKLPEKEWSKFLEPKKYKVKTMKLSKFQTYSQGLALPLSVIPELAGKEWNVGDDVTELLGVKYSVEEDNVRKAKSNPDAKYNAMAARHSKLAKKKWFRWLMKRNWGKKLLFFFFGSKKDKPLGFPAQFEFVHKTDENRCLIAETLIETNVGKIPISKIVNNEMPLLVKSINKTTRAIEWKNIKSYQKYGQERTINIRYKKGINMNPSDHSSNAANSITCSYDHKLLTQDGYKKAKNLTIKDKLMMPMYTYGEEAISIIYGMLLGDSHLAIDERNGESSTYRIRFTQGEKQLDYLKEKLRLLNCDSLIREGKSGYCDNKVYMSYTPTDEFLTQCILNDKAVKDNQLIITDDYCKRLTKASLAIWYLDDGSIRHKEDDDSKSPNIEFSTYAFQLDEIRCLCKRLNEFGLETSIYTAHRKGEYLGHTIRLNAQSTEKFLSMISEYIPACMRYKTTSKYEKVEYILENITFNREERVMPIPIIEIKEHKKLPLYDIEVEDNHNFIANGIVNHNCESYDPDQLFSIKEPLIKTLKIDGTSSTYVLERKKFNKYEYYVCSRNVRQLTPDQVTYHDDNVYWNAEFKYHIKDFLQKMLEEHKDWNYVCLQGEIAGEGIQGNPHGLTGQNFFGFNFIDSINGRWNSVKAKELCEQYGIPWVPILDTDYHLPSTMEELKLEADGPCDIPGSKGLREGFVYRGSETNTLSFKNVSRKYLLNHEG